jgi:uncharacterized protein (DUF305 family)
VSTDQMRQLRAASSATFERMFLDLMIRQQEGALTMARTEIAAGKNSDAVQLARHILATQQVESQQMHALLNQR